eukprot:5447786-Pleurochrysis_carterae.AAC.4
MVKLPFADSATRSDETWAALGSPRARPTSESCTSTRTTTLPAATSFTVILASEMFAYLAKSVVKLETKSS